MSLIFIYLHIHGYDMAKGQCYSQYSYKKHNCLVKIDPIFDNAFFAQLKMVLPTQLRKKMDKMAVRSVLNYTNIMQFLLNRFNFLHN